LHRPHPKVDDIKGLSRLVTLPDWQGLGLAFVLTDALASCYKSIGYRFHTYPAHPALIRAFDRSDKWSMIKRPGNYQGIQSGRKKGYDTTGLSKSCRPCAVFEYAGEPYSDKQSALRLIKGGETQ
jgi:GNAT superfamily N-acetyltransferase